MDSHKMNTPAFASHISLISVKQSLNISSKTNKSSRRRRTRPDRVDMLVAPPPPKKSDSQLKERSVAALRGLSDLGGVTVLHEIGTRLAVGSGAIGAGLEDTQLLLGGLIGVWTAALLVRRSNWDRKTLIRESAALPERWDSSVLYNPEIEEDEVMSAVAWLYALDELEGVAAADLLRDLAQSSNHLTRLRLVEALTEFRIRSNVCASILSTLSTDHVLTVKQAATDALVAYDLQPMIQSRKPVLQTTLGNQPSDINKQLDDQEARAVLDQLFSQPDTLLNTDKLKSQDDEEQSRTKRVLDAVAKKVEDMGDIALTRPDFSQIHSYLISNNEQTSNVDIMKKETSRGRIDVPLFEGLRLSEVHGLCALAFIPTFYELMSVLDGTDHPLRFVGLGWLLTMGGLAAYPGSGNLWKQFTKTISKETPQEE